MAFISTHRPDLAKISSLLRNSNCPALDGMKKLPESNLKEMADAFDITLTKQLQAFIGAKGDKNSSLAELVYIEEAFQAAQSGEIDEINSMTDVQLRIVAYSENISPLEELNDKAPFRLRISLLAKFARRPDLGN